MMKYQGIELKEFTSDKPVIFDPPKKMAAWDDNDQSTDTNAGVYDVVAYIPARAYSPVITGLCVYEHCAEIPEKPKPRRATNRELAKWLAQGNGEYRTKADDEHRYTFQYNEVMENEEIESYIVVRKWGDTEWHEPTVDYMFGEDAV